MSGGSHLPELSREWWESMWVEACRRQLRRPVHPQVRMACEQEWFPRGARLLDVGCGTGQAAAWLARVGYQVTGIDFSQSAIGWARRTHSGQSQLRFAEHDICSGPPPGGPFGALLDWGCLHVVPEVAKAAYARNLAAVSDENARLLLFHIASPGTEGSVISAVEELLVPEFELVGSEECKSWRPGVVFRFSRRPS